jgi:hypothetical protein
MLPILVLAWALEQAPGEVPLGPRMRQSQSTTLSYVIY